MKSSDSLGYGSQMAFTATASRCALGAPRLGARPKILGGILDRREFSCGPRPIARIKTLADALAIDLAVALDRTLAVQPGTDFCFCAGIRLRAAARDQTRLPRALS